MKELLAQGLAAGIVTACTNHKTHTFVLPLSTYVVIDWTHFSNDYVPLLLEMRSQRRVRRGESKADGLGDVVNIVVADSV